MGINTQMIDHANFMKQLTTNSKGYFCAAAATISVGIVSAMALTYIEPVNFLFVCFVIFVLLLTLINPVFSVLVVIASTPFNEIFFLDAGVKIRLYEVLVLVMLVPCVIEIITGNGKRQGLKHNPLMVPIIAIILTDFLSLSNTSSVSDSIIIVGINIFLVTLYFLIYHYLSSVKIYEQALLVLIFVSNLAAVYGIYQSIAYFANINVCLGVAGKVVQLETRFMGPGKSVFNICRASRIWCLYNGCCSFSNASSQFQLF